MEQIYKQIPKQRRPQEHYTAPFPIPAIEVKISDELIDKLLIEIDDETQSAQA